MYQFRTTLGGTYKEGESYDVFSKIIVTEDKLQSLKEAVIKEINQRHTQWQEIVSKALETEDVKEFFSLLYSATEEFRNVVNVLRNGNYQMAGVKGILTQAECILNVADNVMAE